MRKWKNYLAASLAGIMLVSLTGCGTSDQTTPTTTGSVADTSRVGVTPSEYVRLCGYTDSLDNIYGCQYTGTGKG